MCLVCHRRQPKTGLVCDSDRHRIAEQLADLPRQIAALTVQLVPAAAGAGAGDRVTTSRTAAPLPVRLDALSLRGPGSGQLTHRLHPKIRRWYTTHTVQLATPGGEPTTRQVTTWHQELVRDDNGNPIMIEHDDQVGVIPPVEWLRLWAHRWRAHFAHHHGSGRRRSTLKWAGPTEHDPLAQEWETRFGEPSPAPTADVNYLLTWLESACAETELRIDAFAAELRALSAELTRVLGDRPAQQWLGRCPAILTDPDGPTGPCGAGLWQDPHAGVVQCARCHTAWGHNPLEILTLARDIRSTWPIDFRRRYRGEDIDNLPELRCRPCTATTRVQWRHVTATTDTRRWWQPDRILCPNGCPEETR